MGTWRYPIPQDWQFNDADYQRYNGRYWRCPVRLVREGLLAKLWRVPGTVRGGGAATGLLPVLACHTWPEHDTGANDWTGWTYLSRRRMATLAGLNKDTATHAVQHLMQHGLMEIERRPRAKYEGGYKTYCRLATTLYPQAGEAYAMIPASLFYGGTWFMLPSPACRHLYVVLACLDPIGDEAAYLDRVATDVGDDWHVLADKLEIDSEEFEDDEQLEATVRALLLARRRQSAVLSLSEMESYSGLQRSTVIEALQVLTTPIFDNDTIPLIAKGEIRPRMPTWYAPDRRAWRWYWKSEFLNAPERVRAKQRQLWPSLTRRRNQGKGRRMAHRRRIR
jgi:hypothetical protein